MIKYLKDLKLKLQFTGWLQYILPAVISLILLILCGLFWLLNISILVYILLFFSAFFLIINVFDILTVKFGLRPKENLPKRRDGMDDFDIMRARVSCRSFQNRKLTPSDYNEIKAVVEKINLQKNNNIGQYSIRFEYIHSRLTVWPVVGAQEFLVAIAPKKYNRESVIDVGRNLQKVVHHATKMGLGTCWIGPGADQTSIAKQLGKRFNSSEDHIICVCAIGYKSWFKPIVLRLASIPQHKRLAISSLFFTDKNFKKPVDLNKNPFNRFGRCYEVCQWSPSSFNSQTTRCIAITESENNMQIPIRFDFFTTTKSKYYAPVALGIWCANWEIGCKSLGINGHFEVLTSEKSDIPNSDISFFPVYGASWILESKI